MRYLIKIFKSNYCKIVFLISLFLSYLLLPKNILSSWYFTFGILFMITISLTITCLVRNIKEKIVIARTYKNSIINIILTVLGISALQVCGIGAPVCAATVSAGFLGTIFPSLFLNLSKDFAIIIIILSIGIQIFSLYSMKCFKVCSK